jgi:hypothetical protein
MLRTTLLSSAVGLALVILAVAAVTGDTGEPTLAPPGTTNVSNVQQAVVPPEPLPMPRVEEYHNSGCLPPPPQRYDICPGDDLITLTVHGRTLHTLHENAVYNCCVTDIAISVELVGSTLYITEEEINPACFCICCYTIESTIVDLAPGTYTVEYCWIDEGPGDPLRCHVEDITVSSAPYVGQYSNTGCKELRPGGQWPCPDPDRITFTPGAGTLHVLHENATYNCCVDEIVISAGLNGNVLTLVEGEMLTIPCDCECCCDTQAEVVCLPPGTYTVEFHWFDPDTGQWECYVEVVQIA